MIWLRLLLVAAVFVATSLPCAPAADGAEAAPHAAPAAHSHGAAVAKVELRALCPCGCGTSPAAALTGGVHGDALLPASTAPRLPRAAHEHAADARFVSAPSSLPDPVPRLA